MKKLTAFLALFLLTMATANAADSITVGDITASKAWARASTGAGRPGGAFLTIANTGTAGDQLVAAETPAAGKAELHTHIMDKNVMKMRQVMAIDIPGGGMTMLKPGSFHVMLFKLKNMLKEGDMFPLTLTFKKAGKATIMVHVGKAGGMMPNDHSTGHMKSPEHMKQMENMNNEEHMKQMKQMKQMKMKTE
jgi:copper(I)-binding protein